MHILYPILSVFHLSPIHFQNEEFLVSTFILNFFLTVPLTYGLEFNNCLV